MAKLPQRRAVARSACAARGARLAGSAILVLLASGAAGLHGEEASRDGDCPCVRSFAAVLAEQWSREAALLAAEGRKDETPEEAAARHREAGRAARAAADSYEQDADDNRRWAREAQQEKWHLEDRRAQLGERLGGATPAQREELRRQWEHLQELIGFYDGEVEKRVEDATKARRHAMEEYEKAGDEFARAGAHREAAECYESSVAPLLDHELVEVLLPLPETPEAWWSRADRQAAAAERLRAAARERAAAGDPGGGAPQREAARALDRSAAESFDRAAEAYDRSGDHGRAAQMREHAAQLRQ